MVEFDNKDNTIEKFIKGHNDMTLKMIRGMSMFFLVPKERLDDYEHDILLKQKQIKLQRTTFLPQLSENEKLLFELGKMEGRIEALMLLEKEAIERYKRGKR